ncbi:MAG: tRNA (guanine(10)-N(2))-dimethyltransferase [Candidatus Marsarchaeota archaeon]|nr:tRNA (guanine(10)-N(2))-dimethyltransferase [Candidatus Marsarchaeota archaeon]
MRRIIEGRSSIAVAKGVFYNPKMSKLRDVSVMFLKAVKPKNARLLDATAATGVRGIRYRVEAGIKDITMLDINASAYRNAKANAKTNRVKAKIIGKSLQEFAGSSHEAFDVIDLDPFGSPAPLVHDALKLSKDGTLLMITATDTATLCGAEGSACLRIYGSQPIHNELCHEGGVRILLNFIAREAAQFNFGVEPLLSIADMHYMRVFVALRRGASRAAESVKASGPVAYCSRCHNFTCKQGMTAQISSKCGYCGATMRLFGPMWLGNLKNSNFVSKMAGISGKYGEKTAAFLHALDAELDLPFFYSIPKITSYLRSSSVPMNIVIAKIANKSAVSRTHFEKDSIKTDAGINEVIAATKFVSKNV